MLKRVCSQPLCRSALPYARRKGKQQHRAISLYLFVEPGRGQLAVAKPYQLVLIDDSPVAAHCGWPSKARRLAMRSFCAISTSVSLVMTDCRSMILALN